MGFLVTLIFFLLLSQLAPSTADLPPNLENLPEKLKLIVIAQEEGRLQAIQAIEGTKAEMQGLEDELSSLERALTAAHRLRATTMGHHGTCMWRRTRNCDPHGPREPGKDKPCHRPISGRHSGYCDCNGDFTKASWEPGYDCETSPQPDCETICEALEASEEASPAVDPHPVSEAVAIEEEEQAQKAVDDVNAQLRQLQHRLDMYPNEDHYGYYTLEGQTLELAVPQPYKMKVNHHPDGELDARDRNYTIEFFKEAHVQMDLDDGDGVWQDFEVAQTMSLGKWEGWVDHRTAHFHEGAFCWGAKHRNGPQLQLYAHFVCGLDAHLKDFRESNRCVWEVTVVHPGACDPEQLAKFEL